MKIEICANSIASAKAAQIAGADRIELCTELSVGGLTPSHGLLTKAARELHIPIHVLIRPRSGNFSYSADEIDLMLLDIAYCRELGCAGIVSGALAKNEAGLLHIDQEVTAQLIRASADMEFTFHRAYDWVDDPLEAICQLTSLGVTRLLTSGQKATAIEGLPLLKEIKEKADHLGYQKSDKEKIEQKTLEIMPGSGINIDNVLQFKNAGFEAVHFSAVRKEQVLTQKPKVPFHSDLFFEEGIIATSDQTKIKAIKQAIKPI